MSINPFQLITDKPEFLESKIDALQILVKTTEILKVLPQLFLSQKFFYL